MRDGRRASTSVLRFRGARDGATAIEFALLAPVLILLFLAAIEVPRLITTSRRIAQATSTMADLIAGGQVDNLAEIYASAQIVAAPYDVTTSSIVLTAGGIYDAGNGPVARACSSAQQNGQAWPAGSDIGTPPPGTARKGDRFVMAETILRYKAIFSFLPGLDGWTFRNRTVWPVRPNGTGSGQVEVVLPGGKPCPS